jgi:3',5'-nucleoside bisphosphate phosphatase
VLCDLHTHSRCSDGTLSPTQLLDEAQRHGVRALALTDHDTLEGFAEASERGRALGIEVLSGVELSVSEDEGRRQLHLLGYGVSALPGPLLDALERLRIARQERAERSLSALRTQGIELDPARVREIAGSGTIGRPHLARALVEAGHCSDSEDAFARFLRTGRPAYVPSPGLAARDAIALVHQAGGVASLAHPPLSIGIDREGGLEKLVGRLIALGLDGLEVDHPKHTPKQRRRLARWCREHGLLATGGSDFHGDGHPERRLGRARDGRPLQHALYESLRERIAQGPRAAPALS